MPTLLRQREHTHGVNSFFIGWLGASRKLGPQLRSWLSASESAKLFEHDGQRVWVRPDGAGHV